MSNTLDLETLDRDASKNSLWRAAMVGGPLLVGFMTALPALGFIAMLLYSVQTNSQIISYISYVPYVTLLSGLPVATLLVGAAMFRTQRQNKAIRAVVDLPSARSPQQTAWTHRRRLLRVWQAVVVVLVAINTAVIVYALTHPLLSAGVVVIVVWGSRALFARTQRNILAHSRSGRHAQALEAHDKAHVFFIAGFETAQVLFDADRAESAFEVLRIATHGALATPHLLRQWTRQSLLLARAQEAMDPATIALQLAPGNGPGNRLRAEVDLHLGEVCDTTRPLLERALAYEDRALTKTCNETALVLADLAWLAALNNDPVEAHQRLDAAREVLDATEAITAADVHLRVAFTANLLGDSSTQRLALEQIQALDPTGIRGRLARQRLSKVPSQVASATHIVEDAS